MSVLYAPVAEANEPPHACFTQVPAFPVPDQSTTFDSTCSTEPDGFIVTRVWDLDNDGSFDDGSGLTASRSFPAPGTYTVRLRVADRAGASDTESKTVTVNALPTANFTNTPAAPQTGQLVTFNSTSADSDGTITGYAWDTDNDGAFDDGMESSASRTFATPGDHMVKLRVTDNRGATATVTRTIAVANRAPASSFDIDPATATLPTSQSFRFMSTSADPDGTIASQAWDTDGDATADFNDGVDTSAEKAFATAGTYPIRLRVTDNSGAQNTITRNVVVTNRGPTSSFTFTPSEPTTGDTVRLESNSTDPDGTIVSYAWALDADGVFNDGTMPSVSRDFLTRGNFTVKLKVTDNDGAESISSQVVTVSNRPPSAAFTFSPAAPLTGQPIEFNSAAADPDGTITSLTWALDADGVFDDGDSGQVIRAYDEPGSYTVQLRARDNDGGETIEQRTVVVSNRPPTAGFTYSPAAPVAGEQVTLNSTAADADGSVTRQDWDLDGDGAYDDDAVEGAAATVTFPDPGLHVVGLRVADDRGATSTATQTIDVAAPPLAPRTDADPAGDVFDVSVPVGPEPPPVVPDPIEPLRWLDPFPTVRIRGRTTPNGVRLTLFSVRGPVGSTVMLRCSGRGCPAKSMRATIKNRKRAAGTVRFRRLERSLRRGVVLEVYVQKKGLVGKYTRFKIRSIALPIRQDRCLMPDSTRPVACPAAQ